MAVVAVVLVALVYVPFFPQVSVDLRTTTATNARSSVVATEIYQAWITATILWTTTTMQVGGRTATIPIPYTAVVSDVVRTYTSRTTVAWIEVTTVTYSSSTTRYEGLARTHPLLSFLLVLASMITPIIVYLHQRKMIGENIA
jgi:hypothetical protein